MSTNHEATKHTKFTKIRRSGGPATGLRFLFILIAGFYALPLLVLPGKKAAAIESRVAVAT